MVCETCKNGEYPMYGPAPHECFWKKGPEYTVGQSTLLPIEAWPNNFLLEVDEGKQPQDMRYPNACGIYLCPDCDRYRAYFMKNNGKGEYLWSAKSGTAETKDATEV